MTLNGDPQSTNHLYRHKCLNGVPILYMTTEGKALKEQYQWEARTQWRGPALAGEFRIEVILFFPDKRRRDWDNWHKISMDALTGIVWRDDSQIVRATVEKRIDAKRPRIEILIK